MAIRVACNAAKNVSERAAKDVGRFATWKRDRVQRPELEVQRPDTQGRRNRVPYIHFNRANPFSVNTAVARSLVSGDT